MERTREVAGEPGDAGRNSRCHPALPSLRPQGSRPRETQRRTAVSVSQTIPSDQAAVPRGNIVRYTFIERVNHWISAVTYTYCLITGLAFWSPYLFWMATIVGGGPTARFWHPWFGLMFMVSVWFLYQTWQADMRITDADLAWKQSIDHYIRNEDEMLPPIGRFN
ncbi:MAG: hypothetical protein DMG80_02460 [Acidobacteria bacterium]|nr:MAG: hypothetical protein DMG80_02460 [Acidobacteriota bacterium]